MAARVAAFWLAIIGLAGSASATQETSDEELISASNKALSQVESGGRFDVDTWAIGEAVAVTGEGVARILAAAEGADRRVRPAMIRALTCVPVSDSAVTGALLKAVEDPNPDVAAAGAYGLGVRGGGIPSASEGLKHLLRAERWDVLIAAAFAWRRVLPGVSAPVDFKPIAEAGMRELERRLASNEPRGDLEAQIVVASPDVVLAALPQLVHRATREEAQPGMGSRDALRLFGSWAPGLAMRALSGSVEFSDDAERIRSAGFLKVADGGVVSVLASSLHDPDKEVRLASAWALGMLGSEAASALPELEVALLGKDAPLRREAGLAIVRVDWTKFDALRTRLAKVDAGLAEELESWTALQELSGGIWPGEGACDALKRTWAGKPVGAASSEVLPEN